MSGCAKFYEECLQNKSTKLSEKLDMTMFQKLEFISYLK